MIEGKGLERRDVPLEKILAVEPNTHSQILIQRSGRPCIQLQHRHERLCRLPETLLLVVRPCCRRRRGRAVIVVNDPANPVRILILTTKCIRNSPQPEIASDISLISRNDDIVSLAHADGNRLGGIGRDRDEVGGNDSEGVVVNRKVKVGINGAVDETDPIRATGGQGRLPVGAGFVEPHVCAVDEAGVEGRWTLCLRVSVKLTRGLMIPVIQEHNTEVFVIVGTRGAMDDDTAEDAFPSLETVVRMVPTALTR